MQTATSGSVKFSLEVIYHGAVYRVHSEITNMNLYIFSSIVLLPVRLCASAAVISIASPLRDRRLQLRALQRDHSHHGVC